MFAKSLSSNNLYCAGSDKKVCFDKSKLKTK